MPDPDRLGKYEKSAKLGEGGMGEVWKAFDTELERWVALKFMKHADAEERARFRREAQTAAQLAHPNIAAVYDAGDDFIAMQYIDGQTMSTYPRHDRRRLVELARDAARALVHAHERGIVHRDLKPANLMVDRAGRLFVMDFGLARRVQPGGSLTVSGLLRPVAGGGADRGASAVAGVSDPQATDQAQGGRGAGFRGLDCRCRGRHRVAVGGARAGPPRRVGAVPHAGAGARRAADARLPAGFLFHGRGVRAQRAVRARRACADGAHGGKRAGMVADRTLPRGGVGLSRRRRGLRPCSAARPALRAGDGESRAAVGGPALLGCGNVRLRQGDLAAAAVEYDRAIGHEPGLAEAYGNRGSVRHLQGDLGAARADFDRAIEFKPDLADPWSNRGNLRDAEGDLRGALGDYARAIELNPRHANAFANRAGTRQKLGDVDGALSDCDRALALNARHFNARRIRANALAAKGDHRAAIAEYDRAGSLDSGSFSVALNRANSRVEIADFRGAIDDYGRAIDIKPAEADAWIGRGYARDEAGDVAGALADIERGLALGPDSLEGRMNRGAIRWKTGDRAGAIGDFEHARKTAPAGWSHRPRVEAALRKLRK